ncbi:uncharacterized protein BDZ99DRAFT_513985 [Mytilinidion resinicola]|uniref:Uncharacterized protein n=1 Tax=Mytilinidion resinicola TaxID=574789 RepID=A0A6A6ZAN1_9PEZI|nr:uncharacterized protein BDZ99DRAFT_513985 [Mytilinidion resinicola]KAF2817763.1 hypothetical protein BDZ99DRAFT_513985 [Mytilinidion resinicola]
MSTNPHHDTTPKRTASPAYTVSTPLDLLQRILVNPKHVVFSTQHTHQATPNAASMAQLLPTKPRMPTFRRIPQKEYTPVGSHREIEECLRNREHLIWQVSTGQITAFTAEYMDRLPGEPPKAWGKDVPHLLRSPVSEALPPNHNPHADDQGEEDEHSNHAENPAHLPDHEVWWLSSSPVSSPPEPAFRANPNPTPPTHPKSAPTTASIAHPGTSSKRPPASPVASNAAPKRLRVYAMPTRSTLPTVPRATGLRSPYFAAPHGGGEAVLEHARTAGAATGGIGLMRQHGVRSEGGGYGVGEEKRARGNALVDGEGFLVDMEGRRVRYGRGNAWAARVGGNDGVVEEEGKDQEMVETSSDVWEGE